MSQIRMIDILRKEIHHVKVVGQDAEATYEPTMVVFCSQRPGRSFAIPLGALWKYIDPIDNRDEFVQLADREDFEKKAATIMGRKMLAVSPKDVMRVSADIACLAMAQTWAQGMGMLLCTSWNLAKILQMFEIQPTLNNAAQLLLWIQDNLDDLKNCPEHSQDEVVGVAGEVTLMEGSSKIATRDIEVTATDLLADNGVMH
jgi:hypothetical protein